MIKKFIDKLLGKSSSPAKTKFGKREEIGADLHKIAGA